MIRINRLTDEIDKELDRLSDGPTIQDIMKFESVLARQFNATQARVHVQTGSLKTSGKVSSSKTPSSWEGNISYGGLSGGIHNPVDYAEFERERDGAHDFLAPAVAMEQEYLDVITNFFKG